MKIIFVIKLWYNELSGNSNVHPTRLFRQRFFFWCCLPACFRLYCPASPLSALRSAFHPDPFGMKRFFCRCGMLAG